MEGKNLEANRKKIGYKNILTKKNNMILKILIFFFSPFISFTIILLEKNKRKYDYVLLSFYMGYLAYFMIPYVGYDNGAHYETFEILKNFNVSEFVNFIKTKVDFGLYLTMFIFAKTGLNYYLMVSFLVVIGYSNFFKSYRTLNLKNRIYFFIYYINIPFYSFTFGIRNGIALSFIFYSICLYENNKKYKAFIFCMIASLFHIMALTYLIFIIINFKKERSYKIFLILAILINLFLIKKELVLMGLKIIDQMKISNELSYKITVYSNNQFGIKSTITSNTGLIFDQLRRIFTVYLPMAYVIFTQGNLKYRKYIYISLIIYFLSLKFETINYRYSILIIFFTLFSYYQDKRKKYKKVIMFSSILWSLIFFYSVRIQYYDIIKNFLSNNIFTLFFLDLDLINRIKDL